ncbi:putative membrane protein [Propionispora sp. 2/2-37]|nr:putative membrane protein [Propionispora sp. 2/2-37]
MQCYQCKNEIPEGSQECPFCQAEFPNVQILSPKEQQEFQGVTIDQGGRKEESYERPGSGRIHYRQINFNLFKSSSWLTKIVWGVVFAGLLLFAFSSLFFVAVVGAVIWLLLRIFR